MSAPFLIFALPRSRTAWLANYLTHGNVECGHELMTALCQDGLRQHLTQSPKAYAGNADTMQAIFADDLRTLMPAAPIVVIKREMSEVLESLQKLGLPTTPHLLDQFQDRLDTLSRLSSALTIRYSDLSAESTARVILAHIAPSEPFDRSRWQMLQGFNVQITTQRLRSIFNELERNHS